MLAKQLEPIAHLSVGDHFYTTVARHLGAAAAFRGDFPAAQDYYAQAIEVASKIGFRPEIALTHLHLAELMADSGPFDRVEALRLRDMAIRDLREMHMHPALERAQRLSDSQSGAFETSVDALTSREREVATLLAAGRSNREIAQVLVISEGTVGVHVKHVLSKLGLRSRSQVAALLAQQP